MGKVHRFDLAERYGESLMELTIDGEYVYFDAYANLEQELAAMKKSRDNYYSLTQSYYQDLQEEEQENKVLKQQNKELKANISGLADKALSFLTDYDIDEMINRASNGQSNPYDDLIIDAYDRKRKGDE